MCIRDSTHGGVWASGSKWHYAPMATMLAQAGILTAVMEYSLYPSATTEVMIGEVSDALDWIFDNSHIVHGSARAKSVTLMGHSAGAQLCALALIKRASRGVSGKDRMPDRFVGMAGVYHIGRHFEYEMSRGVHALSTMERAVGGQDKFSVNSPTVILRANALQKGRTKYKESDFAVANFDDVSACTLLNGDVIPHRAGLISDALPSSRVRATMHESEKIFYESLGVLGNKEYVLDSQTLRKLPPTTLMASCSDVTVPWYESSEFCSMLHTCGVPDTQLLLYNRVGHGDFVVDWNPSNKLKAMSTGDINMLPAFASDLVRILQRDAVSS